MVLKIIGSVKERKKQNIVVVWRCIYCMSFYIGASLYDNAVAWRWF